MLWRFQHSLAVMILLTMTAIYTNGQEPDDAPPPRTTKNAVPPVRSPDAAIEDDMQQRAKKSFQRELKSRQKIEAALDEDTAIDVIETPFADVIRDIAKEHKLNIVLDPEGLEEAGVTADQLVNLNLKDISLRSALRILLQPVHLAAVIRNEVLEITSLDCSEPRATVRAFPVGELLTRLEDPTELTSAMELVLPDTTRVDRDRDCQPKFRVVANYLVVRGSPRHHLLAEQFLQGIVQGKKPQLDHPKEAIIQREDPLK